MYKGVLRKREYLRLMALYRRRMDVFNFERVRYRYQKLFT